MTWPIVDPDDDGIRPAGKPDRCFYCSSMMGEPHGQECAIVTKRVALEYRILVEVEVPHFWTAEDIDFHRNESSWCAGNITGELERFKEELDQNGECFCNRFESKFVNVVRQAPKRQLRSEIEG